MTRIISLPEGEPTSKIIPTVKSFVKESVIPKVKQSKFSQFPYYFPFHGTPYSRVYG